MSEYFECLDGCRKCKLWEHSIGKLKGQGSMGHMMFVGTNPSIKSKMKDLWEDPYGKYFGSQLDEAGIDKRRIWVTNIVKCSTPNNEPPEIESINACRFHLVLEIYEVDPNVIVAMGKLAMEWFGAKLFEFTEWRGFKVIGVHHPSFIERYSDEEQRGLQKSALIEVRKMLEDRIKKVDSSDVWERKYKHAVKY